MYSNGLTTQPGRSHPLLLVCGGGNCGRGKPEFIVMEGEKSETVIVPEIPGNAGGGKGCRMLDFRKSAVRL